MTANPFETMKARLAGGAKWIKGAERTDAGWCLYGALVEARYSTFGELNFLCEVAREQYPDRMNRPGIPTISQFNDHEDTTWPDIELVLEKTALRWDEQVRP